MQTSSTPPSAPRGKAIDEDPASGALAARPLPDSKPEGPLVSVVISAYNVAPFIRTAVESALRQTYEPLEVIVADDGSTDGTLEEVERIEDSRLRVLRLAHQGVSKTLNAALAHARGDYVGFLDGDDLWAPQKVERHVAQHASSRELDLTFSLSTVIDEHGRLTGPVIGAPAGPASFRQLLAEYLVRNGSATVVRREALERIGGFDPEMASCNDVDLCLRLARLRPGNVYCIAEPLTYYRRRSGQLSGNWRRMRDAWQRVFAKMQRLAPEDFEAVFPQANVNLLRYLAFLAYESGELRASVSLLHEGFRVSPGRFLGDTRNLALAAACLSAATLPKRLHEWIEDRFRRLNSTWGRR